jgi:alginate O-acetyltransferase complex protein AlgJ
MQSREEIAKIEIGQTDVSPGVARALVAWFLLMLAVLPAAEMIGTARGGEASPWSHLARVPGAIGERLKELRADTRDPGAWRALIASNRAVLEGLSGFETALEDQSAVGRALRPPTQQVLSGVFGAGNERAYVGRDGWLFYRPDVEYVTGRGFLEARELERRVASASEYETPPQPDPRPAILRFERDLAARGITLVLMPTPVKPSIHGSQLWAGFEHRIEDDDNGAGRLTVAGSAALQNVSYDAFIEELRRAGILVFDASDDLAAASASAPQYLATDTHWRPESMQRVAELLASFLQEHVKLPPIPSPGYDAQRREALQLGDTAAMLDLPQGQSLYPRERVTLRFISDAAGDPWRSSRGADILLLGDSFTNMYSLATMGWGEAAGLAEQLSYILQRPIDRIVQNDQGAYATRALLNREIADAADRLAGTRVLIWQFAARELSDGDWKVIEMPPAP